VTINPKGNFDSPFGQIRVAPALLLGFVVRFAHIRIQRAGLRHFSFGPL